jgi:hypothetical protein
VSGDRMTVNLTLAALVIGLVWYSSTGAPDGPFTRSCVPPRWCAKRG